MTGATRDVGPRKEIEYSPVVFSSMTRRHAVASTWHSCFNRRIAGWSSHMQPTTDWARWAGQCENGEEKSSNCVWLPRLFSGTSPRRNFTSKTEVRPRSVFHPKSEIRRIQPTDCVFGDVVRKVRRDASQPMIPGFCA